MSQSPPPNAKIYDRPEKTGPSPLLLALLLLVVLVVGYFIYRAMNPPAAPQERSSTGVSRVMLALGHEGETHGASSRTGN